MKKRLFYVLKGNVLSILQSIMDLHIGGKTVKGWFLSAHRSVIKGRPFRMYRKLSAKVFPFTNNNLRPFATAVKKYTAHRAVRIPLAVLITYFILSFCMSLFLPKPLFKTPYSKVLYSADGKLLGAKIADDYQWRFPYTKEIPENYCAALLLYEDSRFFFHPGIDPLAVIRAARDNLKQREVVSGGSTISMQVMRLAMANSNRTWKNKITESLLTIGLELRYSKKEILALYASQAPYGGNIVGLEAAAWRYFGRDPHNLSWAEYALLAVLPNSPALIHPGRNRELLKLKRDTLLLKLYTAKKIDKLGYTLSVDEPLPLEPHRLPRNAPHLLETLARTQPNTSRFYTTLNRRVQERANTIIRKHHAQLASRGIYNTAALIIDNESSSVVAYIGNVPEGTSEKREDHGYAVDITCAPRSTGSILKPFLYAAMLSEGEITPEMLIPDIPMNFGGYRPENYNRSFSGVVPAKKALAHSLNVPAVAMLKEYGYQRFYKLLKEMGMTTLFRKADGYGLSLILGGAEGTLWDICTLYTQLCAIAKKETFQEVHLLQKTSGKHRKNTNSAISPGGAYLTLKALLDVERPGVDSYWKSFARSQKVAWKTGTSLGHRDAWAVGLTPRYTVGVWCGNADGEGKPGMTGLAVAAPVLFELFSSLERSDWFTLPHGELKEVEICARSGYLPTGECETATTLLPVSNTFSRTCPYHRLVHLDQNETYQVTSSCTPVSEMKHKPWFVLPPAQEYYYTRTHSDYRKLPPFRNDCPVEAPREVMSLVYPAVNTSIYIPVDIDGKKSEVIFRAVHTDAKRTIFWHLDETYIGKTENFHEITAAPATGHHNLTLVDDRGNRISRSFTVKSKEDE